MTASVLLFFVLGLVLLVVGAEALVRGAARLAARLGVSSLVIGLTVVAFGTSAPELAVSLTGALAGQADLALGNVVGSNIFNVLFILGATALIAPLVVDPQLLRRDVPLMIAASGLCWLLAADGAVGRIDGALLCAGIVAYTAGTIVAARRQTPALAPPPADAPAPGLQDRLPVQLALVAAGLAMLVVGSGWLVDGAIAMARALGVSELVISLTIVAAGTSLPEVATSMLAAIRGERDIAVGNVVGSNIFNILCVLGVSALAGANGVAVAPQALAFDIPVMTAAAVLCVPLFLTGRIVSRLEGALFTGCYVAYTAYLVLAARQHPLLADYAWGMRWFVLPAVLVGLLAALLRDRRRRRDVPAA